MNAPAAEASDFQVSSASAVSVATRAAGAVVALGYLCGIVPGPVVAVVGGMALMTYGRNLLLAKRPAIICGAALAVVGGALGIAALRWGALDLGDIRGVQSVLGPTVLVGPTQAAVATGVAAVAASVALAVWCSRPWPRTRMQTIWWGLELVIGALAIATVFLDPAQSALGAGGAAEVAIQLARWVAAIAAVGVVVAGAAWLLQRSAELWRLVAVAAAGAAVMTSAGLILSVL